jgi:hypothetical protein
VKDVKQLSNVGEASYMVPLDPGGLIFSLEDSFTQHNEWSRKSDVIERSPFLPYVIEGLPSPFDERTLEGIQGPPLCPVSLKATPCFICSIICNPAKILFASKIGFFFSNPPIYLKFVLQIGGRPVIAIANYLDQSIRNKEAAI